MDESEGGVPLTSEWGASFRRLIARGYQPGFVPGIVQPPLPIEAGDTQEPNREAGGSRAGAVAGRVPLMYGPAYNPRVSGTMLYTNYLGAFVSRPAHNSTVYLRKGYAGIYPADLQPVVAKVYPWSDPTRGAP